MTAVIPDQWEQPVRPDQTVLPDQDDTRGRGSLLLDLLKPLGGMVVALGALIVVWVAFLRIFDVSTFVGVSPRM